VELLVHCYSILGSAQDAEDATLGTLLAAWRGLSGFEGHTSLRTWLYRIATSRCLDALRSASRRPHPDRIVLEAEPLPPTRLGEVVWLEPYLDVLLDELADTEFGPGCPGARPRKPSRWPS
jgi:RNA polymerase sigma-70 factor (ECF subfamily)